MAEATVSSRKMWVVRVTDLGTGEAAEQATVAAGNWLDALKAGREKLALGQGMPPGASCSVNDSGSATVHDPTGRKTYHIEQTTDQPAGSPADDQLQTPEASGSTGSSGSDEKSEGAKAPAKAKVSNKTVAYGLTAVTGLPAKGTPPTPTLGDAPETPEKGDSAAPSPSAASSGDDENPAWIVVAERDSAPTSSNPLYYRERSYAFKTEQSREALEQFLRARCDELQAELDDKPRGKFFNLAAFDHEWDGKPSSAPLATLSWKDWRGEPVIAFVEEKPKSNVLAEARWSAPPETPQESGREEHSTTDHDVRLMRAFEASQDLLFLSTPIEGMQFVIKLLEELVPCEAASGCLYDINTDELRFVALTGPGEGERRGHAVQRSAGLMGLAVRQPGVVLKFNDFSGEGRFDKDVDGRPGFESRNALYCALSQQGRLLGVLQLSNRRRRDAFTEGDVELLDYVAAQMSKFLQVARTTAHPTHD